MKSSIGKFAALVLVLAACGTGTPGGGPGGDGGGVRPGDGGGVSVQGLTVTSNGNAIGILLDVLDESGAWKVYSEEFDVAFRLNPRTGVIGSAFDMVYYANRDCTGQAYIATATLCAGVDGDAEVTRLLVLVGGDKRANREGNAALVGTGAMAPRAIQSIFQMTTAGRRCVPGGGDICGVKADPLVGFPLHLATPLALR